MGQAATSHLLQQLAYQAPVLLVYLVGLALGLATLRRHLLASILTAVGNGLSLVITVVVAIVQACLFQARVDDDLPVERYAQLMSVVAITGSVGRAVGIALIVAAVFVGRRRPTPVDAGSGPASNRDHK